LARERRFLMASDRPTNPIATMTSMAVTVPMSLRSGDQGTFPEVAAVVVWV